MAWPAAAANAIDGAPAIDLDFDPHDPETVAQALRRAVRALSDGAWPATYGVAIIRGLQLANEIAQHERDEAVVEQMEHYLQQIETTLALIRGDEPTEVDGGSRGFLRVQARCCIVCGALSKDRDDAERMCDCVHAREVMPGEDPGAYSERQRAKWAATWDAIRAVRDGAVEEA